MLRELRKIRVRTRVSKDRRVPCRDHAPSLALECPTNDRGPAASATGVNNLVYELNELVGQTYSYLLAHTNTVPNCYQWRN